MFEITGTDGTIASQGREQHQRSVFISRFRGELEFRITPDFRCWEPTCSHSFWDRKFKRETPWCARYYRHQNSYYPVAQASATGQLSAGEPPTEVLTCADKRDDYSSSETGDSESDEDFANKGCKTKNAHQKKERFSLVQVKVTVYWKLGFGNPLHDPLFRMLVCLWMPGRKSKSWKLLVGVPREVRGTLILQYSEQNRIIFKNPKVINLQDHLQLIKSPKIIGLT